MWNKRDVHHWSLHPVQIANDIGRDCVFTLLANMLPSSGSPFNTWKHQKVSAQLYLKFSARATVKLPLPQYSSRRSPEVLPCVTFWAHSNILQQTLPLGCEKAPSTCKHTLRTLPENWSLAFGLSFRALPQGIEIFNWLELDITIELPTAQTSTSLPRKTALSWSVKADVTLLRGW